MSYCALADIQLLIPLAKIVELTDDDGNGIIDAGVVDQVIKDADSEIDVYCSAQYTTPFTAPVPDLIKRYSIDISIYRLYSRRLTRGVPDAVRQRYEDAIALLKRIADGLGSLPVDESAASDSEVPRMKKTSSDRIFTDETLEDY